MVSSSAATPIEVSANDDVTSLCAIGCAGLTAYGAVTRVARVAPGDRVVVIGAGSVGQNVVQAARAMGAERVVAVDRSPEQLTRAVALGATDVILAADDVGTVVDRLIATLGRPADVAFECSGVSSLSPAPLRFVRNGGLAINLSSSADVVAFDMNWFQWDKRYVNPLYGASRPSEDVPAIMALRAQGRWGVDQGLGGRWRLSEVENAIRTATSGASGKALVLP